MKESPLQFLYIDLFCGAGGVTTGLEQGHHGGRKVAKVIACVNHDPKAIESHARNHRHVLHFTEDIRTLDLTALMRLTAFYRVKYPQAKVVLWASLECTNFSKAKGGMPRDADSRTLAEHLDRYVLALNPDLIQIENVEEFMAWGPLDEKGKPLSRKNGRDYRRWVQHIEDFGYRFDHRILNAADYGAYTSRKRFFGQFAAPGIPIAWPEPTHSRTPNPGMFGGLKPWKAVREVLDFGDEGASIFGRRKPLVEASLARIYHGLRRHIAPQHPTFLTKYYGTGMSIPTSGPADTLTTKDRMALVRAFWLDKQYSGHDNHQSVDRPTGALMGNDKHCLMEARCFLLNPQYGNTGNSVEAPAPTLIASMGKRPLSLVTADTGLARLAPEPGDSPYMRQIKELMAELGVADIKMRMLRIPELKRIQGFPQDYYLAGNQSDQKKFIGNSVPPRIPRAMVEASARALRHLSHQITLYEEA